MGTITQDIIDTHEEMIMAAFVQGVTETDKQMPTEDDMILYAGKVVQNNGCIDYVWRKGEVAKTILRVHPPQLVEDKTKGDMVHRKTFRKIEQVWMKGQKGYH